jgi:hypothetical protein
MIPKPYCFASIPLKVAPYTFHQNFSYKVKGPLGSPNSFLKKNSKNCDIFGYLVLPLFVIVVMETRFLSEFFLFATRLTICVTIISKT